MKRMKWKENDAPHSAMENATTHKQQAQIGNSQKKSIDKKKTTADESDLDWVENSKRAVKKITTLDYQVWSCTFFICCAVSPKLVCYFYCICHGRQKKIGMCVSVHIIICYIASFVVAFSNAVCCCHHHHRRRCCCCFCYFFLISFQQMHSRGSFVNWNCI